MLRAALLLIFVSSINVASSTELQGTVCLGKNLAKTMSEHSDRLYLKIDDSQNIVFAHPYDGPIVVMQGLDLSKEHMVYVYFDDQIAQSWRLNFSKLKTDSVLIWRAAGSWRMEPNEVSACK